MNKLIAALGLAATLLLTAFTVPAHAGGDRGDRGGRDQCTERIGWPGDDEFRCR